METILKIEKKTLEDKNGFSITTNKKEILIYLRDTSCLCGEFGSLEPENDLKKYIDSELITMSITHKDTIRRRDDNSPPYSVGVCFVNLETSNGIIKLGFFNNHNGCVGHRAEVKILYDSL